MYLSRIKLNTSLRKTMQAMASPNLFHGAIENAENGERTRKLWRLDNLYGDKYLLILSEEIINFSTVSEQFGFGSEYECKCYDSLLERITNGSKWHFRLKANPIVQSKNIPAENGRGKVLAHISTAHQEEWLKRQSIKNGFSLSEGEWLVTESRWYMFKKNREQKNKIKLLSVTYEGILTVTDSETFKKALINGIGREKAYGMGFLTVVEVRK